MKNQFINQIFLIKVFTLIILYCQCDKISINEVEINYLKRDNETDFTVRFPLKNLKSSVDSSFWVGIGINSVPQMNDANVVVCIHSPERNSVSHYINEGYSSHLIESSNPSLGIKNSKVVIDKTYMTCSFSRENSNSHPKYFGLIKKAHILVAFSIGNEVAYHGQNKGISNLVDFQSSSKKIPRILNKTRQELVEGSFNLTWKQSNNATDFVLYTNFTSLNISESTQVWSAVVLNSDGLYGVGDITICKFQVNESTIDHHYFNLSNVNEFYRHDTLAFTNSSISYEDSILACSFSRVNSMANNSFYFDLSYPNKYIIKVGKGTIVDDLIDFEAPSEDVSSKVPLGLWE